MTPAPRATYFDSRSFLKASFVTHAIFFALRFTYMWLDDVVNDEGGTFWRRFIEEGTGSFGAFLVSWFVFALWRARPLRGPGWWRHVPLYLALGVANSAFNTSWMWASRNAIFALLGLGDYDYGRMPLRYLMELPASLIGFVTLVSLLALADEILAGRERARREAELERALVESQLQGLRLRLQPHFLFNALNTIAERVHDAPDLADRLIGRLADLLRASLRAGDAQEVALRDELALLGDYLALMQARFGDRLTVRITVAPGLDDVLVPSMLLQPLVENAMRHGGLESSGRAVIEVRITRRERESSGQGASARPPQIALVVRDDGPGLAPGRDPLRSGTGLSATAHRLALLHGEAASLVAANVPGGFAVTITLPERRG